MLIRRVASSVALGLFVSAASFVFPGGTAFDYSEGIEADIVSVEAVRTPEIKIDTIDSRIDEPNKFGINVMIHEYDEKYISLHMEKAYQLVGSKGWVKAFSPDTTNPKKFSVFVSDAYRLGMIPVLRIGGWDRPDPSGYDKIANDYVNFIQAVNFLSGQKIRYVEARNEPNLGGEWGGAPNPSEYGLFLLSVSRAFQKSDPDVKVLNGGLAQTEGTLDGKNIQTERFIDGMFTAAPELVHYLSLWSSHPYPQDFKGCSPYGTSRQRKYCFDGYLDELEIMRKYYEAEGRGLPNVAITETSWKGSSAFHDSQSLYTPDEFADAFRNYWLNDPRVAAVIPFALTRYPNGSWANYEWVDPKGLVPNPYYERVRNLRLGFKN